MRLATRLKSSIQKLKAETTSTDAVKWEILFDEEMTSTDDHLHWYMAQLAHLIFEIPFRVWGKLGNSKPKDFILRFSHGEPVETEEQKQANLEHVEHWKELHRSIIQTAIASQAAKTKEEEKRQEKANQALGLAKKVHEAKKKAAEARSKPGKK